MHPIHGIGDKYFKVELPSRPFVQLDQRQHIVRGNLLVPHAQRY